MANHPGTALRISASLLVFAGYLALASVRSYGPLVLAIPAIALFFAPFGERLDAKYPSYRIISLALTITYFFFIPLSAILLGLLDGVIMLTTYIQIYTLVHVKSERNYYHLYLMSFFILLAACVQAPEPVIAFVLLLYLVSAIWAFVALRIESDATQSPTGADAEITGLREGRAQLVERGGRLYDGGLIAAITATCVLSIGLTAAIFYFTPRIEAGFLGNNAPPTPVTGLSDQVALDGGAYVQEDQTAVMHVSFPEEPAGIPGLSRLYWRVSTFPRFQQGVWRRDTLQEHGQPNVDELVSRRMRHHAAESPLTLFRNRSREGSRRILQEIYMDNVPRQGMPALDLVQQIEVGGSPRRTRVTWDDARDFTAQLTTAGPRQLTYEAWSEVFAYTPDELRRAPMDFGELSRWDTDVLTYEELLPQTQERARTVTADAETLYDKCVAIESMLSSAPYEYTLDVPALPPDHGIDLFINEIQRGHCEFFASAMALMLRSLGVPTRVVGGYAGGEYSESDQGYTVRQSMAHLWVEVFFPGFGWVRFDPSPPSFDEPPGALQQFSGFLSGLQLRAGMFWYREVVGFDSGLQFERLRNLSLSFIRSFQFDQEASPGESATPSTFRVPVGWLVVFSTALAATAALLFRNRKRILARDALLSHDQRQATRLFQRLRGKLARAGIDVQHKTAEELLALAQTHPAVNPESAAEVLLAYNEIRFGLRPLPPARWKALNQRIRRLLRDSPQAT